MIAIGYIVFAIYHGRPARGTPDDHRLARGGVDLPWLAGILIISWQGQYEPSVQHRPHPVLVGPAVLAAFSLVIYYWAMATRLPREEMLDLVERQGAHGDEPEVLRH